MYVFLHLQVFMHVLLECSTVCVWCRVSWEWHFFFSYYGIENWLKSYPKIIALMGVKDSVMFCGHFINSFFSACVSSFFRILQTQLICFRHLRLSSEGVSDLVFPIFCLVLPLFLKSSFPGWTVLFWFICGCFFLNHNSSTFLNIHILSNFQHAQTFQIVPFLTPVTNSGFHSFL